MTAGRHRSFDKDNALDKAIKWVTAFNDKYGVDIGLKVRLYSGMNSPQWIKEKAGFFTIKEYTFDPKEVQKNLFKAYQQAHKAEKKAKIDYM